MSERLHEGLMPPAWRPVMVTVLLEDGTKERQATWRGLPKLKEGPAILERDLKHMRALLEAARKAPSDSRGYLFGALHVAITDVEERATSWFNRANGVPGYDAERVRDRAGQLTTFVLATKAETRKVLAQGALRALNVVA